MNSKTQADRLQERDWSKFSDAVSRESSEFREIKPYPAPNKSFRLRIQRSKMQRIAQTAVSAVQSCKIVGAIINDRPNKQRSGAISFGTTEQLGTNQWREIVCSIFPSLSLDWVRQQPQLPWIEMREFASMQVMEFMSDQPIHVVCQSPPVANDQRYKLTLLLSGRCHCRHADRETYWEAGDLVLFDGAQSFDVVHPADFHVVTCNLPQKAIYSMLAEPDNSAGVRISGRHGAGAILSNFTRSLVTESAHCSEATQRQLIMHLTSLIGLALGGSELAHHSRREAQRAAHRQQVFTYIETHLRDPRLCPQSAAHDLRISVRSLHLLLEDCEMSFARWVTQRRLEECTKMLNDPACDQLTIAEVAFRCGFNELSTFNRCFRAQYGMTPSEVRQQSIATQLK